MPIYFGGNKIGKISLGSTTIGKVYHGSTLVYENRKKIPVYGYAKNSDGSGVNLYLLGSNSTSGAIMAEDLTTLETISGTLGASGSIITVSGDPAVTSGDQFTYYDTLTYNGVKVYMYTQIPSASVPGFRVQYVAEDARVGSKCGHYVGVIHNGNLIYNPSSVTSSTFVYYNQNTFYRKAANDTNYTRDGFNN